MLDNQVSDGGLAGTVAVAFAGRSVGETGGLIVVSDGGLGIEEQARVADIGKE
jgi:hypothetical protein